MYPGRRFTDYAILGDDVVIACPARHYERALAGQGNAGDDAFISQPYRLITYPG